MTRTGLLALFLLPLAACEPSPAPAPIRPAEPAAVAAERAARAADAAPAVVLPSTEGPVELASLAGRPVVLQFAAADDAAAWAALGDALADLEAAGATVVAVTVGGAEAEAAAAFGYRGAPLAVVVDGAGAVRGRATPRTGDDLFRLASPVLAEADVADTIAWEGAGTVAELAAAGGLVIDVTDPGPGAVAAGLHVAADTLAAIDLPADLGTPIAFVGPDAAAAADRAAGWGYAAVYVVGADGALAEVAPAARQEWRPRRPGGARG